MASIPLTLNEFKRHFSCLKTFLTTTIR